MDKKFSFTLDDNIRFLKDLSERRFHNIFDHPYLQVFYGLHQEYDLKVQLNLFYRCEGFDLSQMTLKFKSQFEDNADWLKMSFHSKEENYKPYEFSGYDEVRHDITSVNEEIIRFAGEKSLAKTTTVHYCLLTATGLNAVKDCQIKGLLGLFGNEKNKRTSYGLEYDFAEEMRKGKIKYGNGIYFSGIDVILNLYDKDEINERLKNIIGRDFIKIMIHEQYFYKDYFNYQPDFAEKTESAIKFLIDNGYKSVSYEEMI